MESPLRDIAPHGLTLFETLRFEPRLGPVRGALHLARMARGAAALGWVFDAQRAAEMLEQAGDDAPLRLRLELTAQGDLGLTTSPYLVQTGPWRVGLAEARIKAGDPWRAVKTSNRAVYDQTRAALPDTMDEVLVLNERGTIAEGTITNVFVQRGAHLVTPPLADGCLPGVLRETLLADGTAAEGALTPSDLRAAGLFFVGNSLRGLIPAYFVE